MQPTPLKKPAPTSKSRQTIVRVALWTALALGMAGCNLIWGIEDAELYDETTTGAMCDTGCDDQNVCTTDECIGGSCRHSPISGDPPVSTQTPGDCQIATCGNGQTTNTIDNSDVPNDGNPCTIDTCGNGIPANTPQPEGHLCTTNDGTVCNATGTCVECNIPVDCGGDNFECTGNVCSCLPLTCLELGMTCGTATDGCNGMLNCGGAQDGAETDIDCGGITTQCDTRCAEGRTCVISADCVQSVCYNGVCNESAVWLSLHGDINNQSAVAVASDSSGDLYVVGNFSGSITIGGQTETSTNGSQDMFLAAFTTGGTAKWVRSFGGTGVDTVTDVAVDSLGRVVIAGSFSNSVSFGGATLSSLGGLDAFYARFTPATGTHQLSVRAGASGNQIARAVATLGTDIIIGGEYTGSINFGVPLSNGGGIDGFVARVTQTGSHVWSRSIGAASDQRVIDVATDSSDHILVAGSMQGQANFGQGTVTSSGGDDIFLVRYAPNGVAAWGQNFGDASNNCGTCPLSIATDSSNAVMLVGGMQASVDFGGSNLTSAGNLDGFIVKFSAGGGHQFSQRYGDALEQTFRGVTEQPGVGWVVVGTVQGAIDFGGGTLNSNSSSPDIAFALFTDNGAYRAATLYGDPSAQRGLDIASDPLGASFYVVGEAAGTLTLTPNAMAVSSGGSDAAIMRLVP